MGCRGSYDHVAEALFGGLAVDGFFLEYDDERSGGFAPLRFVPQGKMVVLGLVTTKRGELESKDVLKRRIDEAARYVPLDQLCLSPQCGFSSTVDGNALTATSRTPSSAWSCRPLPRSGVDILRRMNSTSLVPGLRLVPAGLNQAGRGVELFGPGHRGVAAGVTC